MASFVEVSIVIELAAVDLEQANVARHAFSRFGKGRHPAELNYGDCFAYALGHGAWRAAPGKSKDFARTDITRL